MQQTAPRKRADPGDATAYERLRRRVFHLFLVEPDDVGFERAVNIALLVLILANVLAVVLETIDEFQVGFARAFQAFEWFSVVVFSVEYLARVWSCTEDPAYRRPVLGRIRYVLSPMALVDLCAIAPTYVPWLIPVDLRFTRVLRLFRLARSLKIARYSHALGTLTRAVRSRRGELGITALAGAVLLLFASSAMYYVEHDAQPKAFSSIPAAMWWGVVTLTTVGYGDIYPVTSAGKALAGFIAIMGIGLYALPAGIVASGFSEELRKRGAGRTCPHCGGSLEG